MARAPYTPTAAEEGLYSELMQQAVFSPEAREALRSGPGGPQPGALAGVAPEPAHTVQESEAASRDHCVRLHHAALAVRRRPSPPARQPER